MSFLGRWLFAEEGITQEAKRIVASLHAALDARDKVAHGMAAKVIEARTEHAASLEQTILRLKGKRAGLQKELGETDAEIERLSLELADVSGSLNEELVKPMKSPLPEDILAGDDGDVISFDVLDNQDDRTSNAIIRAMGSDATFQKVSKDEMEAILQRDQEDDEKLAKGIELAVAKGVIEASPAVETVHQVDVLGKSAEDVANEILSRIVLSESQGVIVVLQGLSGTGKGTTVGKLRQRIPNTVAWSNGNVFRALTLLAATHCQQQGIEFSPEALTPENLAAWRAMLEFGQFKGDGSFDIKIEGLGISAFVSDIANTDLKGPLVKRNIPTVAKFTQGEVISFASAAFAKLCAAGINVLLEGRAQTVNYIRSPYRFELVMTEPMLIGMRRAAQRVMAGSLAKLKDTQGPSPVQVSAALAAVLTEMATQLDA